MDSTNFVGCESILYIYLLDEKQIQKRIEYGSGMSRHTYKGERIHIRAKITHRK